MFLNVIGASSGRKLYPFVNTKTRTKKNVGTLDVSNKVFSHPLSRHVWQCNKTQMEINSKELEKPEVPTIQSSTDAISETVTGNENEEDIDGMTKKVRKRKKALYSAIRDLMEFYFSDANISKDRFMQNAIKDGPGERF